MICKMCTSNPLTLVMSHPCMIFIFQTGVFWISEIKLNPGNPPESTDNHVAVVGGEFAYVIVFVLSHIAQCRRFSFKYLFTWLSLVAYISCISGSNRTNCLQWYYVFFVFLFSLSIYILAVESNPPLPPTVLSHSTLAL